MGPAHTPVLPEKQTRDHLSVMGGMTPEGKVYTLARQESLNGLHSIEFLQHLLRVAGVHEQRRGAVRLALGGHAREHAQLIHVLRHAGKKLADPLPALAVLRELPR